MQYSKYEVVNGSSIDKFAEDLRRQQETFTRLAATLGLSSTKLPESPAVSAIRRSSEERLQAKDARLNALENEIVGLIDMIPVIEEASG